MKKTGFLMMVVAAMVGEAQAAEQKQCGTYLDTQVQTYAVEAKHIVDICSPQGEVIKSVKIGDGAVWNMEVFDKRGEIDLAPRTAGSLTNAIVTTEAPDGVERRYEVRLVSIEPDKRTGTRLPSKLSNN